MPVLYDIKDNAQNMKRLYKLEEANVKVSLYWARIVKVSSSFIYLFGKAKKITGAAYKNDETNKYDWRYEGKDEYICIPLTNHNDVPTLEKFFFQEFSKEKYDSLFQAELGIIDNANLLGQVLNSELPQATRDAVAEVFVGGLCSITKTEIDDNPDAIDPQLKEPKSRIGGSNYAKSSETWLEVAENKKNFLKAEFPSLTAASASEAFSLEDVAVVLAAMSFSDEDAANKKMSLGEAMVHLLNFFA